jgi:hypothetical protein
MIWIRSVLNSVQERVQKIKEAWGNRFLILNAVKNYVVNDSEIEALAATRMDICNECPLLDLKGSKCFAPGTQPCCGSCGCSLKLKTRSVESSCPEGKW